MAAYLIVRASVPANDTDRFDQWYETEHLPDAKAAFDAVSACRGWSDLETGLHVAIYEFRDLKHARSVIDSDTIRPLIEEFDRVWQGRVTRTREVVDVSQRI
jgi:hypothetical protein